MVEQRGIIKESINGNFKVNNLIAAILICFSLINGAIGVDGISYITIAIVFAMFAYGVIHKQTKIYTTAFSILLYVIVVFIISFLRIQNSEYTFYYFEYFLGFCAISLFAGTQNIIIENVLKYIEILGCICVVVFLIRGFGSYDASIQMGICYAMLPVLYSSIINIIGKYNNRLLSLVNIIGIIWCYIFIAPRGIWLNIAITVVVYCFTFLGENSTAQSKLILRIMGALLAVIGILILYKYFADILTWVSDWIYKITEVKIYALDKMVFLLNSKNISNGRNDLLYLAADSIKDNFIFGRGIGYFEVIQGSGGYVHNIIYQAICEAGVFFLIPLAWLILTAIVLMLHTDNRKNKLKLSFYLLLLSNGFIILFYSSVYWKLLIFWYFLGYTINFKKTRKIEKFK